MAAVLSIPRRQYAAFKKLAGLSEQQFGDLVKGLNDAPPSVSPLRLSERLSRLVTSIPPEDINGFVVMLCGLYPAKENNRKSAEQIAIDIKDTLLDDMKPGFDSEKIALIERRMRALLSIDKAIAVTAKALDVVTEHNNVFCGSKIYSDIRPIFSADADSIVGGVIVHNLNVSYHQGSDHKEFFAALEDDDLVELKEAIDRAEKKSKQLKATLQKSGVHCLDDGD